MSHFSRTAEPLGHVVALFRKNTGRTCPQKADTCCEQVQIRFKNKYVDLRVYILWEWCPGLDEATKYLRSVRTLLKLAPPPTPKSSKHLNLWNLKIKQYEGQQNSTNPGFGYPDRLGSSGKCVENSTELTCLEITGYRIEHSTALCLLVLRIRRGRKVQTQVHAVNGNSWTSNRRCSLFSKKNPVIRILCISGWIAVPINPDKRSSNVLPSTASDFRNSIASLPLFLYRVVLARNEYGAMVEW